MYSCTNTSAPADAKICSKASCAEAWIFVICGCMFLLSLGATSQLCSVSLKAGLSTYKWSWCARAGGGGGEKGAGQGERGPAYQEPDAEPGLSCHRCLTAYGRLCACASSPKAG